MSMIYGTYDRAVITTDGATLRITIPVARTPLQTLPLLAWLGILGELLISQVVAAWRGASDEGGHVALVSAICVIAGGSAIWYFLGKEIIEIDATTLTRIRQVPFFRDVRQYALAKIANLRPAADMKLPSWLPAQRLSFMTFGGGRIAFDYGRRTRRLGLELSDTDTARVLAAMRDRMNARPTTDGQSREPAAG